MSNGGVISAAEFHASDPLTLAILALEFEEQQRPRLARAALEALVSGMKAYRLAAGDRFTEAKIVGVYLLAGMPRAIEVVYSPEDYDDPVTEAMSRIAQMTGPGWEWVEPPILLTRENIVTEWVEWNYE